MLLPPDVAADLKCWRKLRMLPAESAANIACRNLPPLFEFCQFRIMASKGTAILGSGILGYCHHSSGSSEVAEQFPRHPEVKGSSLATPTGTGDRKLLKEWEEKNRLKKASAFIKHKHFHQLHCLKMCFYCNENNSVSPRGKQPSLATKCSIWGAMTINQKSLCRMTTGQTLGAIDMDGRCFIQ